MIDNGRKDEKIIAIPFNDPNYNTCITLADLPRHTFEEMSHFFRVYKALENKQTAVDEVEGPEKAIEVIQSGIESYIRNFCR